MYQVRFNQLSVVARLTGLFAAVILSWSVTDTQGQEPAKTLPFYPVAATQSDEGVTYVVDRNLPGVWKIEDGNASVFYKGSKKYREPLNAPRCIAIDGKGRVLVGDSAARNIFVVTSGQEPKPLSTTRIGIPMSIAVGQDDQIYVADLELHQVLVLEGGADEPVDAKKLASIRAPRALAVDQENHVWVVGGSKNPVQKISPEGDVTPMVEGGDLQYPAGIAVASDGSVAITDSYQKSIFKLGDDGKWVALLQGEPLVHPVSLVSSGDQWIVADSRGSSIWSVDSEGKATALYQGTNKE